MESKGGRLIASLKSYSRIARILLGILGVLLVGGIIGSILMGVRAKNTAQEVVVSQAQSIADSSLSLVFEPSDLTAPATTERAAQLTEQIQRVVVDPSDFDSVTVYSPEGTILYSNEEGRIGNTLPGLKDQIRDVLRGATEVTPSQDTVAVMLPLRFQSGVGSPAAVELTRSITPIATAAGPWNTNAMFLFGLLVVLGLVVFGVARLLSAVNAEKFGESVGRPMPKPSTAPRVQAPTPGLREEGEARRRAEDRASAAEDRLSLLQDQYRKSLEELQGFRAKAQEKPAGPDPKIEQRALRAEGQVRTLEQQVDTLRSESIRLSDQLKDALRMPVAAAPASLDDGRLTALEEEAADLRHELETAREELQEARAEAELAAAERDAEPAAAGEPDPALAAELDTMHVELLRTRDDLTATSTMLDRSRRELDDARIELRALRNEEQRAAMLEDELRTTTAELESRNASFRAELVEREADFETKVRDARELFQRELTEMEAQYRTQVHEAEEQLTDRITEAEGLARHAAAELETARADLDAMRSDVDAARGEAKAREQRLLEAHDELLDARERVKTLEREMKERSTTVTQAHKEVDEVRRSLASTQADLGRADEAIEQLRADIELERQRAEAADQSTTVTSRERDSLQERVDKLIRQLDEATGENQELNRRLQDADARRQLELADDAGRTQIDALLQVTQERLAGQTEKLIAAEDRARDLELALIDERERADVAEADVRTHQMSEALREMREHDGTGREAGVQREIAAATSAAIDAGALEDRRGSAPILKELSMEAKRSIAKIDGISKLLKHKKDPKDQAQLMKQLATHTRRLDHTVADLAEADRISNGTIDLAVKRTDMEALVARVVEESGADGDNDIRIVADSIKVRIDPQRTEQILSGLIRMSSDRTQNGKTIIVRVQSTSGGALMSVEDPGEATEVGVSPMVRRLAEIQGGWLTVEEPEGGGAAFRVFLPDGATPRASDGESPALQITVDGLETDEQEPEQPAVEEQPWEAEAAHQELAAELRRFAQLESEKR